MPDPGDASQSNETDEQGVLHQILTPFAALQASQGHPESEENFVHLDFLSLPGFFTFSTWLFARNETARAVLQTFGELGLRGAGNGLQVVPVRRSVPRAAP
jgi:hypothetical protein